MEQSALRLPNPSPTPPHGERRRSVRQKLHSPVYVSFNGSETGMVLDLSELLDLHENGFAVQTAVPSPSSASTQNQILVPGLYTAQNQSTSLSHDRLEVSRHVSLCLDLPETKKYVHGSGQVMWTDATGRAGIRFSFLPDASRQNLKEWLFSNLLVASTNHAARVEQLSRRQLEDSRTEILGPENLGQQTSGPEILPWPEESPLSAKLAPISTPAPASADSAPGRPELLSAKLLSAELLSALDDVRREVHDLEAQGVEADHNLEVQAVEAREFAFRPDSSTDQILRLITERAAQLTSASGAALALVTDGRMLCRANAGNPAPPVGSEVDAGSGLSAECIRTGLLVSCEDPETDARVDPDVCRALGIGSFMAAPIMAAPILEDSRGNIQVVGLLEIFASHPRAFSAGQATILERLVELVPHPGQKPGQKSEPSRQKLYNQPLYNNDAAVTPVAPPEQMSPAAQPVQSEIALPEAVREKTLPQETVQETASTEVERYEIPQPQVPTQAAAHPDIPYQDFEDAAEASPETTSEALPDAESDPVSEPKPPRAPLSHLTLLAVAVAVIALVLGYLLAPAIEKRLADQSQSAQSSVLKSGQISSVEAASPQPAAPRVVSLQDLRNLADHGDADAQWQLGILYHGGEGVPQDDAQAVQWFQRAADQGYVRAQATLGAYYWAGRGVSQDFSKAYFWSQLALAQGDENSKSRLEGLAAQMTQAQVSNARQQAESWLQAHNQAKPSPAAR